MIRTQRLLLRRWKVSDLDPFARINADPRVMEFLPKLLSRAKSDEFVKRIENHFRQYAFGLYAAELQADNAFIGFVGLSVPNFNAEFMPCVEIGWRLAYDYWGQGLATEGAKAIVRQAFGIGLPAIVSFTAVQNIRSRRVMEKLGMKHDSAEDFDHPNLPSGHPLCRHVLYRLNRLDFAQSEGLL